MPGAFLILQAEGNTLSPAYSARTDAQGHYRLSAPRGPYRLTVVMLDHETLFVPSLDLGRDQERDFEMVRQQEAAETEMVVSAAKQSEAQVSQETLSTQELSNVAGSAGDPLRAVQSLPGVVNAGIEYAGLLVRGSGPDDNLYLVDRIPIGFPFHFGGAISTLDPGLIEDLSFTEGGAASPYATVLGGVVDVTQRDPRQDRWGVRADVNILMAEAEAEGPVTPDSSLIVAGRRSYLGYIIQDLSPNSFTAVPTFEDYQVKYSWRPSPTQHWDFEALGSDDRVGVVVGGSTAAQDPVVGGVFNFDEGYNSQGIDFRDTADGRNLFWNTLYHSNTYYNQGFGGGLYLDSSLDDFGDWFSWTHDFDKDTHLETGLQYDYLIDGTNAYYVVLPVEEDESNYTFTLAPKLTAHDTQDSGDLGAYFDQKFKLFEGKLQVSAGARADYLTYIQDLVGGPQVSAAYLLTGDTTLKGSYGYDHEAPSRIQGNTYLDPILGNPGLLPEQAIDAVLGLEQKLDPSLILRVEAYEKDFSQMIASNSASNYAGTGTGTAQGVEFFLRREPSDNFFGWVSYSLSRSQRQDAPGGAVYTYDFDEPQVFNAVAHYQFAARWDAGAKVLFSSGLPYTPIPLGQAQPVTADGSVFYIPPAEPVNSARLPDYFRVDLSTSFKTVYKDWEWKAYLDLFNAFFTRNVLGYQYNSNYTGQAPVLDLPLLPYAGFEAKF